MGAVRNAKHRLARKTHQLCCELLAGGYRRRRIAWSLPYQKRQRYGELADVTYVDGIRGRKLLHDQVCKFIFSGSGAERKHGDGVSDAESLDRRSVESRIQLHTLAPELRGNRRDCA